MTTNEDEDVPIVNPGHVVTIAGESFTLEAPVSIALALDLLDLAGDSEARATAGALVACCSKIRRRVRVTQKRAGYNAAAYGSIALDAFAARKAPLGEVYAAGLQALYLCLNVVGRLEGSGDQEEGDEGEPGNAASGDGRPPS